MPSAVRQFSWLLKNQQLKQKNQPCVGQAHGPHGGHFVSGIVEIIEPSLVWHYIRHTYPVALLLYRCFSCMCILMGDLFGVPHWLACAVQAGGWT